ncbi:S8 family serine peptidase [Sphingomonas sp.]|uniref:S8 family serine peptidase n=1 Tax=Sphingomonas sp. TaxID=28214 RepID=UPI002E113448|nr:S8 family serine peptidase [Sphingomonas sp.]HEV7288890.1 S8 family serine peptidase [Sphingomonas sp.]
MPPAPSGGYYLANGQRTTDYAAAIASWRNDAQFAVDYTKAFLGMEHAYALGLSGRGQTIGINDSGVLLEHPLFSGAGKISGIRTVVPDTYGNDGKVNPRRPWEIHGTHVAGTAAGGRSANGVMFGNAFGANILSATTNFSAGDFLWWKDQILDGTTVATAQQNIVDLARTGRVRIINNSWGSNTSLPYTASMATARAQFRQVLNGFYDPVLANDVLVVFSAGNGSGVHASIDAVTPLNDLRLRSNWLSIANYQANGTAAASTSLCGQTATWCAAGPGSSVVSGINTYTVNTVAIRDTYRAAYPAIYSAGSLGQLQNAATNAWLTVLNGYLSRRAAAELGGLPFDEAAEYANAAQQAVAITLAYGSRFIGGDLNGYTSVLANILTAPGNVAILGRDFSAAVLVQADALLTTKLPDFVTFTGPGYGALTGTSMAAPNISGFAAVLMEFFPDYNTGLIADILLSSSRDLDTAGVDLRSGWGAPQMDVALAGPTALRQTRDVNVSMGTIDIWSNNIQDARDRYAPEVLAGFPDDIGGIVKRGGGELILAGVNSYSGATRVDQGTLTVNGSLTRSGLTVASGGTLGGNGTLTSLTAQSGGIVSPGSVGAIGTLTVGGAVTLASGSQFVVDIGASGTSDRIAAATATLGGGTITLRPVGRLPRFGDSYTVLTATGEVTGTFGTATSFSAILFPQVSYSTNAVRATVAARPYAGVVASTPVQTSYARLLDGNRSSYSTLTGIYDALDLQSAATIQGSLEAIAPRAETTRRAIGVTATDNMARFFRDRTSMMSASTFEGGALTMIGKPIEFAANAIALPGQNEVVADSPAAMVREGALPENVAAYLAGGYLKGSGAAMPGTTPAGDRDSFDGFYIVGGLEARVSDTVALGFGLSYSSIEGERTFGQSAKGELIQGTLYGRHGATLGISVDAQVSAGVYQSATHRTGSFAGTSFDLRGRDNALALSSELGVNYWAGSEKLRFGPRVALRASRIGLTPTVETGTGPALFLDGDNVDSVQGRAGLQLDGGASAFRPFASAYLVHDFVEQPGYFNAGFAAGNATRAPFLVASQDRNWGELGGGFAYRTGNVTFSVAADVTVARSDVRNSSYRAGLKVAF